MAGHTLKELKDRVDVVKSTQLEMRLNDTLIGKYRERVDSYILDSIKSARGNVDIPTMQKFRRDNPRYTQELKELYIEKMQSIEGCEKIDIETMVAQAALFDSLCFVFDFVKDTYSLVTMNFDLLYDLDVEYDMLKQVLKKNREGIVKAYRIDVEYNNGDSEFTFKAVNARDFDIDESKPDTTDGKRFFLVPYIFSVRLMKIIESLLNKNLVLRIHQAIAGVEKVRFITKNDNVLSQMCDIPEAVKGLQSKFFPLKGFFYAPVVGAPSTTAMVTNINIFDMFKIVNATPDDFKRFGVHKPVNPVRDLVGESLVVNHLMKVKDSDDGDFAYIINNLPYRNKYLASDIDSINEKSISKYLHSVTESALKKIYSLTEVDEEIDRRLSVIPTRGRALTKDEINDIENVVKTGIVRLVIQKKDCKLSSIFCTNDKNVLVTIYGPGYERYYEGFSVRFFNFCNTIKSLRKDYAPGYITYNTVCDVLKDCGFPIENKDFVQRVLSIVTSYSEEDSVNKLKPILAEESGVNLKLSESRSNKPSSNVLVRSLTAYLNTEGKPVEYYKYVDKSKIVSGILL